MADCRRYQDLALDFVYGLLEGSELLDFRAHVTACPACQASLTKAEQSQKLLGRATDVIPHLPPFTRPDLVPPAEPLPAVDVRDEPAPVAPAAPRRRFPWRRALAGLAAAACVALVLASWQQFSGREGDYRAEVIAQQHILQQLDAQLDRLQPQFERESSLAARQAKDTALHLHVMGSRQLDADLPGVVQVATRGADGKPLPAKVHVKLTTGEQARFEQTTVSAGRAELPLPPLADASASEARLEVRASSGTAQASVAEPLPLRPPQLAAHLATDKEVYEVGNPLRFRALLLQAAQRPPQVPVQCQAELLDPTGQSVATAAGATDEAGVFSGELAVAERFLEGPYELRLTQANARPSVLAARKLEVARGGPPEFQLDKDGYRAGDVVNVTVNRRLEAAAPRVRVNNQLIPAQTQLGLAPAAPPQTQAQPEVAQRGLAADAQSADRAVLQFKLPEKLDGNRAMLDLELRQGRMTQRLRQEIPLVDARPGVEFLPEGGTLVAGVPNRVYFRAQRAERLRVESNDKVVYEGDAARGSFVLTPEPNSSFQAKLISGDAVTVVADRFRPSASGVALGVVNGSASEGEAVRVTLSAAGERRHVLVLLECRSQVVAQHWLEVGPGQIQFELKPPAGVHGLLRVAAYEPAGESMRCISDRWVYRAPARRLGLDVTVPANGGQASIRVRDETGRPATAWALVSVADERTLNQPENFAALLLLGANVTGLEDPLLLAGTAEAARDVDLALALAGPALSARQAPLQPFFSRENLPLERLQAQAQAEAATAVAALQARFEAARTRLEVERTDARRALAEAQALLAELQARPARWLRGAVGVAWATLILGGLALLAMGVYRALAGVPGSTARLGWACACLLAVLGLSVPLRQPLPTPDPSESRVAAARPQADFEAKLPKLPGRPLVLPQGQLEAARRDKASPAAAQLPAEESQAAAPRRDERAPATFAQPDRAAETASPAAPMAVREPMPMESSSSGPQPIAATKSTPPISPSASAPGANAGLQPAGPRNLAFGGTQRNASAEVNQGAGRGKPVPASLPWQPALLLPQGEGTLALQVPAGPGRFRLLILAHDAEGRLGIYQGPLPSPAR